MASLEHISNLIAQRQLGEAGAALQKLVRQKNNSLIDWETAMRLAASLGDQDAALSAAQNWRNAAPSDPRRIHAVIEALGAVAKHKEAARLARELQANPNAAADGYFFEGIYRARFGERDKALSLFRKTLAILPNHSAAWEQIALLSGYEDFDADIAAMSKLAKTLSAPDQLIPIHYALGRAYDHAGDTDAAFRSISAGAALRQAQAPFQLQPQLDYLERLRATFTPDFVRGLQQGEADSAVRFILSAPRSGSTLIEQILTTSPAVKPTGEHTLLRAATLALGSMEPPDMQRAMAFKKSDWRKMAQSFETGVRKRFGASKLYTDKTLINYYYAGLIKIIFPAAKMVWGRRDPRDVVWSCFRSRIAANRWAENLDVCSQFIIAHNHICAHWSDLYGDDLLELTYEALVTNPEDSTTTLFAHLNADRPDNWDKFYETGDAVATASLAQVRQPLNTKAIGSWRRYEKHLAPVYDKYFK